MLGSCALVALAVAFACLPDLEVAVVPTATCGDGVVDLEQGEACDPGDAGTPVVGCAPTCQIDCEGGAIDPLSNHCYFWIDGVDSILEAITDCNNANAHLVSFVDLQELQFVVSNGRNLPGAPDSGATWLALTKGQLDDAGIQTYLTLGGVDLPGWSASCAGCFALADGGDADLPLGGASPQDCVNWRRSTTASFTQGVCTLTTTGPILCEREPAGAFASPCDDASSDLCIEVPRTFAALPHKKYVFVSRAVDFANAASDCITRGGMLAHFESSAEREEVIGEIVNVVGDQQVFNVWIGLSFDDEGGAWTWLDGTPATAVPLWADGEPSMSSGAASIEIDRDRFDTRLAQAQDPASTNGYVCQFAK
jgi:hypothetical protein